MTFRRRMLAPLCILVGLSLAAWAGAQSTLPDTQDETPEIPSEARGAVDRRGPTEEQVPRGPLVVQSGPIDPARYVLGPGDVLEVDLWGRVTRTLLVPVSPEGTVFLPGNPPVRVTGKTLTWARDRILRLVGETFRGVQAEVRLVQLRAFKVFVVGAVKQPGGVPVTSVTRASEALAAVGLDPAASHRNIEVRRRDGSRLRVDLELFQQTGREEFDPTLIDGDVLSVPRVREWVGAVGGVARPGRFELAPGDSLSTLLAITGGLVPAAAPEKALLVRFNSPNTPESLWIDLRQAESTRLTLMDGDQLFVGLRTAFHQLPTISIFGEVERPGYYPIMLGRDRFSDAIRWAGGFRPLANRTSVYLLRESGTVENDPEFERLVRLTRAEMTESEYTKFQTRLAERKNSFRIDWSRLQNGDTQLDPLLRQGDVIRVEQLISSVRIEGQVRRPGFVDFEADRPLRDYVSIAGGFTERANKRNVSISRSVTGQVIPARSVQKVLPGDFIWVPERRDVDAWAVFRDVVTVAGQVALLIFTLSR